MTFKFRSNSAKCCCNTTTKKAIWYKPSKLTVIVVNDISKGVPRANYCKQLQKSSRISKLEFNCSLTSRQVKEVVRMGFQHLQVYQFTFWDALKWRAPFLYLIIIKIRMAVWLLIIPNLGRASFILLMQQFLRYGNELELCTYWLYCKVCGLHTSTVTCKSTTLTFLHLYPLGTS